ncbi:hypothetical protein C5167_011252 [Papaver somniferum]|uniref:Uncharacterized protein n=1 Tax=Papaver somniferum TaxID=3469 RepID=A0A4Y7K5E2_PAPSO|nr:hypothetical protein C5167_011252 [Papaver somniferum]
MQKCAIKVKRINRFSSKNYFVKLRWVRITERRRAIELSAERERCSKFSDAFSLGRVDNLAKHVLN